MSETDLESQAEFHDQGDGRRAPRYAVDLAISVDSEHNFIAAVATNLSASGVFVATPIVHPAGTELHVTIGIGDSGSVVRAEGIVRWCRATQDDSTQPMGIGIEFLTLDEASRVLIENFLHQREPMPHSVMPPAD